MMSLVDMKDIKLVVSDLDGTLLKENGELDSEILDVVKSMEDKGILFTLATGRNFHSFYRYGEMLNIGIPIIANNGATIYKGTECIKEYIINADELDKILTILDKENVGYLAYNHHSVYIANRYSGIDVLLNRIRGDIKKEDILSCKEIYDKEIFKITVVNDDEVKMKRILAKCNLICKKTQFGRSEGNVYSITNSTTSKGEALKELLSVLGICEEQCVVFGDNFNDISMFESVEHSVAMDNASLSVKEKAKYTTACNEDNGVSNFLKLYVAQIDIF